MAKHSLRKKTDSLQEQKSAQRAKAQSADLFLRPIQLKQKGFISALDKCSNRYPLVGGTGQRHFNGANFKARNLPENAATPTSRMRISYFTKDTGAVP